MPGYMYIKASSFLTDILGGRDSGIGRRSELIMAMVFCSGAGLGFSCWLWIGRGVKKAVSVPFLG